ncbi:prolyl oligopeptidase family serine peptidase [Pelomonas sp. SE-A7]|uniref:prolyl oligopeptidase family serine peptidase n=1 Tax=Pelomonas sp. SE-A7 TaxID=3054953 RepID=UPI00259D0420|nr:prolyl oligopeptidase family serine peptidase [Pelomonas sp. SE-A7]MDM4765602.1 prolyl oligopeptidase family serine peptidase [Pelomonas sp. SE-A7]
MADIKPQAPTDPFEWLEDVQGERALDWVRQRNAVTLKELQSRADYAPIRGQMMELLKAKDRIPQIYRIGSSLYNHWQDDKNPRGLWRRTSLAEYRKAEPQWETVLDLDELGRTEKENWVFGGLTCLAPAYRQCLLMLSRGGADAVVVREFDLIDKRFIAPEQGGFYVAEAKTDVGWIDKDTLFIGSDFGPGSQTDSGYPRQVRRWQRGQPLKDAALVFEGKTQDVSVSASVDHTPGYERVILRRGLDFYNQETHLLQDGKLVRLDLPTDVSPSFWKDRLLLSPRKAWTVGGKTYPAGSLLAIDAKAFLRGDRKFQQLFGPTKTRSLAGYTTTSQHLLLNISDKVASRLEEWNFAGAKPVHRKVEAPFPGTLSTSSLYDSELPDDELANRYLISYSDFLTPSTLSLAQAGNDRRELLKSGKTRFDATGMRAEQLEARSKDGTRVPYFVLWPAGAKADGNNPTLLYGYGGFEIPLQPGYSGGMGRAWLARGGVYVMANIRGGGEFGPTWHQAATKANKQRSYDDFIAVAEDLIKRRISSPRHLGIMGGSNGGLLVGATYVQRPELFNAVVCQVPLLDMRRYHKLLAGASWMAEYGNPDDPAEWRFISKYSPYQNLQAGKHYPKVLFTTSTRDDRVHPGHARKMAALMQAQGHKMLYYENIEGGHGGAADIEQSATLLALEYSYLWQQLGR